MASLSKWLTGDHVQYMNSVGSWHEALSIVAKPLLNEGAITPDYLKNIIHHKETTGPYFVIAPRIAMPHARPEEGGRAVGLSILKLGTGVEFGSDENDPVDFIVMFSAPDSTSHMEMISELAAFLSDDEAIGRVFQSADKTTLISILTDSDSAKQC